MSDQGPSHAAGPQPVPLRCPRCGANVAPEQDWCLECGAPARTRLAPTPNWRAPMALVAVVVLLAGLALAFAFTNLTNDDGSVSAATTAPAQPSETIATQSVPTAPAATATSAASAAIPGSTG
jgi:ribosomal protein L37E